MSPCRDSVLSLFLALEQALICCHEELLLVPGIIGERSQSEGGRDSEVVLLLLEIGTGADPFPDRFHLRKSCLTALTWKNHDILVSAVPNDTILGVEM